MIVKRQVAIPVRYDEVTMDVGFRADLIIDREIIVEIKSVEAVKPGFKKQVITYLRLTGHKIGLLINFNEELQKKRNNKTCQQPCTLISFSPSLCAKNFKLWQKI